MEYLLNVSPLKYVQYIHKISEFLVKYIDVKIVSLEKDFVKLTR